MRCVICGFNVPHARLYKKLSRGKYSHVLPVCQVLPTIVLPSRFIPNRPFLRINMMRNCVPVVCTTPTDLSLHTNVIYFLILFAHGNIWNLHRTKISIRLQMVLRCLSAGAYRDGRRRFKSRFAGKSTWHF